MEASENDLIDERNTTFEDQDTSISKDDIYETKRTIDEVIDMEREC